VRNVAAHFGLVLRRFPAVQYLGCCSASSATDEVVGRGRRGMRTSCFSKACACMHTTQHTPCACRVHAVRTPCARHAQAMHAHAMHAHRAAHICMYNTHLALSSQACVWRHMVAETSAAKVCSEVAAVAAATPEKAADAAATASGAAVLEPISGKYRSEVELAVHHAIALGLPGARYVLFPGLDGHGQRCSPKGSKPAAQCVPAVGISVPRTHELGFRALLGRLKRRAFRGDSAHVLWTTE
jgi:hypothetical protein